MITLFSQEKVSEIHDFNLAQRSRKEGHAEGRAETEQKFVLRLLKTMSPEQVAETLEMPLEDIHRMIQSHSS